MPAEPPRGWSVEPLDRLGTLHKGRGGPKRDDQPSGVPVIRYGELYTHHHQVVRSFKSFVSADNAGNYTPLAPGDVLFAGAGETAEEIGKSAVFLGPAPAYASGDTVIFRPNGRLDPLFLGYATNAPTATAYKQSVGQGSSILHIYSRDLQDLELLVPPLAEQRKIASILDSVDRAILTRRRVAEQTSRVKQGLLQALVNRGIGHRQFRMTDLGQVPESWDMVRLGDLYTERKEAGRPGLPVMSVTLSDGLVPRDSLDRRVESDLKPRQHSLARDGDLVYNTMRMWQGASGVAETDCIVSPAYVVAEPGPRILPRFARFLFKAPKTIGALFSYSHGITRDRLRLYFDNFVDVPVALPPLDEQRRIAETLSTLEHFEQRERVTETTLIRLKRGLMQDLLTGRVRVQPD